MDPNTTLQRIIDEYGETNFEECLQAILDLSGWLGEGGFSPPVSKNQLAELLAMAAIGIEEMLHAESGN